MLKLCCLVAKKTYFCILSGQHGTSFFIMIVPERDICEFNFELGLVRIKKKPTTTKTKLFKH